jgi:hypothetical protein
MTSGCRVRTDYTFPPSIEHTPLTLIGPPDCDSYGECSRPAPAWESDFSVDPPLGDFLFVHPFESGWGETGWARAYWPKIPGKATHLHSNGTVTVEYLPMWKVDDSTYTTESAGSSSYSYSYDGEYSTINGSDLRHRLKRCRMWPNPTGRMHYPQECHTSDVLVGDAPEVALVNRTWLRASSVYLGWLPATENYNDDVATWLRRRRSTKKKKKKTHNP